MDENQSNVQLIETDEQKKKKSVAEPSGPLASSGPSTSPIGATNVQGKTGVPSVPSVPSASQQALASQKAGAARTTGFTGVGRYLQASSPARLGQKIAGRVAEAGQQAASGLSKTVGQFGQKLGQQQEQFLAQRQAAQSALQRMAGGQVQQIGELAPSQEEMSAYAAISGGQYQAPTGLEDIENVAAQSRIAQQMAAGTQTAAGRRGLLQQTFGQGVRQYTKGQSALDALILGQAGQQLAEARRGSAGLGRQIETQERLAKEKARQFGIETEKSKRELTGERASLLAGLLERGETQRAKYGEEQSAFLKRAEEELTSGKPISREVADALFGPGVGRISTMGFTPQEIANLLEKGTAPTLQTSLTTQQAAQIEALKRLGLEPGIYKSPEEQAQLAGTTTEGGSSIGKGLKFDVEEKYKKKKEAFEQQKNIVDKTLEEIKNLDPGIAKDIGDYVYGRGDFGRVMDRAPLSGGDEISALEASPIGELGNSGYSYLNRRTQAFAGGGWRNMALLTDRLDKALQEISKMGLTGKKIEIKPSLENK